MVKRITRREDLLVLGSGIDILALRKSGEVIFGTFSNPGIRNNKPLISIDDVILFKNDFKTFPEGGVTIDGINKNNILCFTARGYDLCEYGRYVNDMFNRLRAIPEKYRSGSLDVYLDDTMMRLHDSFYVSGSQNLKGVDDVVNVIDRGLVAGQQLRFRKVNAVFKVDRCGRQVMSDDYGGDLIIRGIGRHGTPAKDIQIKTEDDGFDYVIKSIAGTIKGYFSETGIYLLKFIGEHPFLKDHSAVLELYYGKNACALFDD